MPLTDMRIWGQLIDAGHGDCGGWVRDKGGVSVTCACGKHIRLHTTDRSYRVRCLACRWQGVRTDGLCECYEDWAPYCRPSAPGPGCPRGIVWPCPRCGWTVVTLGPVKHRVLAEATP